MKRLYICEAVVGEGPTPADFDAPRFGWHGLEHVFVSGIIAGTEYEIMVVDEPFLSNAAFVGFARFNFEDLLTIAYY